jgi:hypothetical protein
VIRRSDEEHQQADHRGEQHGQQRLCQQTLDVEEVRCKNRQRSTDEDHDPKRSGDGIGCRFDAPPPPFDESVEGAQSLRMNDRLAAGRWFKFENPTPDAEKNLGADLVQLAAPLRWPCDLNDGLRVAKNSTGELAPLRLWIAG